MDVELLGVILIVGGAVAYAAVRIFRSFQGADDPCSGCEMKKNCKKFGRSKENC
jgi:hypothetical protein